MSYDMTEQKNTRKNVVHSMQFDEFLKEESAKIVQTVEKDSNAFVVLGPWSGPVDTKSALNALTAGAKANGIVSCRIEKPNYSILAFTPMDTTPDVRKKIFDSIAKKASEYYTQNNLGSISIFENTISNFEVVSATV